MFVRCMVIICLKIFSNVVDNGDRKVEGSSNWHFRGKLLFLTIRQPTVGAKLGWHYMSEEGYLQLLVGGPGNHHTVSEILCTPPSCPLSPHPSPPQTGRKNMKNCKTEQKQCGRKRYGRLAFLLKFTAYTCFCFCLQNMLSKYWGTYCSVFHVWFGDCKRPGQSVQLWGIHQSQWRTNRAFTPKHHHKIKQDKTKSCKFVN